jgi:hypothetical protein
LEEAGRILGIGVGMMLEPAEYPQLIITHMDDSETVIHLTDEDAYTWQPTTGGLMIRRITGRTVFPWPTVKCYTIVPIAGEYRPSDLPHKRHEQVDDAPSDVDGIKDMATRWAARRGHDTTEWTGPTHWTQTKTRIMAQAYGAPGDVKMCPHGWLPTMCPTCVTSR